VVSTWTVSANCHLPVVHEFHFHELRGRNVDGLLRLLTEAVLFHDALAGFHAPVPKRSQLRAEAGNVTDHLLVGAAVPLLELLALEDHVVKLLPRGEDHVVQDATRLLQRLFVEAALCLGLPRL
jgi:hypothetical protein